MKPDLNKYDMQTFDDGRIILTPIKPEPVQPSDPFGHLPKHFEPKPGWVIKSDGELNKTGPGCNPDVCYEDLRTKSDAKRLRDLGQLMCLIHDWREGWEPNNVEYVWVIRYTDESESQVYSSELIVDESDNRFSWRSFDSEARCDAFIETHRELIEKCRWAL